MPNSNIPPLAQRSQISRTARVPLDFAELARVDEERLQVVTDLHVPLSSDAGEPEPEHQVERDHARVPSFVLNATGFTIAAF